MSVSHDPVAAAIREVYAHEVDLENCDREPLRHIQVVQAHACLLVARRDDFTVCFASENTAAFIGHTWEEVLDRPLAEALPRDVVEQIRAGLQRADGFDTANPLQTLIEVEGKRLLRHVIAHRDEADDKWIYLEVEKPLPHQGTTAFQHMFSRAIHRIQAITDYDNLFAETAAVLKQITGYDRVMVYEFDKSYNGTVIAEARHEGLEPFEGLRYPHTDIPKQARELYFKNRVRLISDVQARPARIRVGSTIVEEDVSLDLTPVTCRGVSPVHLEYLGYMGVRSSLSIAIILDQRLWGLFACHHYAEKDIDYDTRNLMLLIGQIFSGHLSLQTAARYREQSLTRNLIRLSIGEQTTKQSDIFAGLTGGRYNLFNLFERCNGAIINFEGRFERYRKCPSKSDFLALLDWITSERLEQNTLVWHEENIGELFEPFSKYCDSAAGMLIIFLKPDLLDYICWFRPGISQQIVWGGKPVKEVVVADDGTRRLGPRKSFARYVETVEGCSAPWTDSEIDTAYALRITLINSLLQEYSQVKQVNDRLKKAYEDLETFSYTVSHDLRAPLRVISGYSEILQEDYGQRLDGEARDLIDGIQTGAAQMNNFITDILELSRVGSQGLRLQEQKVGDIVHDLVEELLPIYAKDEAVEVTIDDRLPSVLADRQMLRQVFSNLLSNALKYSQPDAETDSLAVHIDTRPEPEQGHTVYRVSNTAPGIDPDFSNTIFEMFSRLSDTRHSEGTGVGLAIVRRIVERHRGRVWVSNDGLGVTFNFYLAAANG